LKNLFSIIRFGLKDFTLWFINTKFQSHSQLIIKLEALFLPGFWLFEALVGIEFGCLEVIHHSNRQLSAAFVKLLGIANANSPSFC
jgi:hypothetical protein